MTNPSRGQLFLNAVLAQTRRQAAEINLIKRLILIEAGEYISDFSCFGVFMRLKTLGAYLLHHALHRRIDRPDRKVIRFQKRLKLVVTGRTYCGHHAVGADSNDMVCIRQPHFLWTQSAATVGGHRIHDIADKGQVSRAGRRESGGLVAAPYHDVRRGLDLRNLVTVNQLLVSS